MTSEVDAFVENSKFEKRKQRNRKSARSLLDSQNKEGEQVDIVLLPTPNQENGDADNEMGDESNLNKISLNQVVEVAGTVEIQTSKGLSKVKTQKAAKPDKLNIRKRKEDYQSKVAKINDVMKPGISKDEKEDKLLKYGEKIELFHDWVFDR